MPQQEDLFGHTGLLQMSYGAVWFKLPMGKRRKGAGLFTFSLPPSVSHWPECAPWGLAYHTSGLWYPTLSMATDDARHHRQYCEISLKPESDERSHKLWVVARKWDYTAATSDSGSVSLPSHWQHGLGNQHAEGFRGRTQGLRQIHSGSYIPTAWN